MELDEETLAELGFGDQWEETAHVAAVGRSLVSEEKKKNSLGRVEQYHSDNPGTHGNAIAAWKKKNPEKVKKYMDNQKAQMLSRFGFMIGRKCVMCGVGKHTKSEIATGRFCCKNCKESK